MPRQIRIEFPGAWYHVMNRGISRKTIFHAPEYYKMFFDIISKVHLECPFEIHAYCFMSNHYHLLIKTLEPNLGKIMRKINGTFARKHNFLQKADGPLFKGRYKAILVDADNYLLEVSRYIHLNPVDARLVENPKDYFWSSYKYYLNSNGKPDWLHCSFVLSHFNNITDRYESFVAKENNQQAADKIKSVLENSPDIPILGLDNFIKFITVKK